MKSDAPDCTIILAAGKGTRMGSATTPKVCFPVNGVPAICRALDTYRSCGINQHILIVGNLAGKVVEAVGEDFENVAFVYQKEQRGTAHALRCVYRNLSLLDDNANVLVAAGDRIIDQSILEKLFNLYAAGGSQLAVLSLACDPKSGQGRIVRDRNGIPAAIIEMADIKQRRVWRQLRADAANGISRSAAELRQTIVELFFGSSECNPAKAVKAFGAVWEKCENNETVSPADLLAMIPEEMTRFDIPADGGPIVLTPDEAAHIPCGNTSVYLLKSGLLKQALAQLSSDNAQQEEYLSDLIGIYYRSQLAAKQRPDALLLEVTDRTRVLGFNNPAELLEVEKILRSDNSTPALAELDPAEFRSLGDWHRLFSGQSPQLQAVLQELYGLDATICERQRTNLLQTIESARQTLPDDAVCGLVRSPGRLNVMGRHIDHQGGNCNLMTIGYETVMVVCPREDDRVIIRHCNTERFPGSDFSISEMVADLPWEDWNSLVNSSKLAKMISEYGVDWTQYIKAAILRLQKKFSNRKLRGMDLIVGGNVPMAAGLSSSSSLVVGAAEAVVAVNRLDTFPAQIVTLCGEGEWFVGTRGGSADHAAVKMGQRGTVVKVRFFPFGVDENVVFPENYSMVICDSGIKARKSSDAKNQFNHRVACYRIGFALIRQLIPQFSGILRHLRDVNPRTMQMPLSFFYRLMLMLPETATRDELRAMLPDVDLETWFSSHAEPADGRYPIRGVVLFGISECERAARYADALKNHDLAAIGQMMKLSHNGDRVAWFDENWQEHPYRVDVSNMAMLQLLNDLESGDPERVIRAQLGTQTGSYACSLPDIDRMVDIADRTPGVLGAQLAGAGLGGCMMVLCQNDAIELLRQRLDELYYRPTGRPASTMVCRPIAGAGMIPFQV
ncbi:MAG: NTP transferase domain-containing protein [Lentisphaeria bacterium]|nr:NTP transferase domain-containing protein [Lentisphaeria bacterium]